MGGNKGTGKGTMRNCNHTKDRQKLLAGNGYDKTGVWECRDCGLIRVDSNVARRVGMPSSDTVNIIILVMMWMTTAALTVAFIIWPALVIFYPSLG